MTIQSVIGKMGCGMGICKVLEWYLVDRQSVLDCLTELPKDCQKCIGLNEKERDD